MIIKYDLALTDWISMGLHKKTLEDTLTAIEKNNPLPKVSTHASNREYIKKVLREEIIKQFSNNKRPILEVVLNSIDAKPKDCKNYDVRVKIKHKKCTVKDNGIGMSLDDVLRVLIIPFNSDKNGLEEIGRFGVGFLSTFKYCVNEPLKSRVCIDTRTGTSGYKIEFYSTSDCVGDLRMSIKKCRANPKGTNIGIFTKTEHPELLNEFLTSHLNNIFSDRCRIFLNGSCVNESNGTWYSHPVNLCVDNEEISQRIGFRVDSHKHNFIKITSQGVLVDTKVNHFFSSTVSLPTAVQLVEGRDEFKRDEIYFKCANRVFFAFEKYLKNALDEEKDEEKQEGIRSKAVNFVPILLGALNIENLKDIPNLNSLCDLIAPGKEFVLPQGNFEFLEPFLSDDFKKRTCNVFSLNSYKCWKTHFKNYSEVIGEFLAAKDTLTPLEFKTRILKDQSFCQNYRLLTDYLFQVDKNIVLIETKPGRTATLVGKQIYINLEHRFAQGRLNPHHVYQILNNTLYEPDFKTCLQKTKNIEVERTIRTLLTQIYPKQNKGGAWYGF